jgi:hypothetical protein
MPGWTTPRIALREDLGKIAFDLFYLVGGEYTAEQPQRD